MEILTCWRLLSRLCLQRGLVHLNVKAWIAAPDIAMDAYGKPLGSGSAMPMINGLVAMILVAGMIRHIFAISGIVTLGGG